MVHSLDGSACNNPDCRNRHLKMQQRFLWKCSESCSPWMLASSGWRRCHCMLARKRLQKPCQTASNIGTIINGYFYLAKYLLSFPPIPLILWLLLRRRTTTMTQNSRQLCIVHQEILQHQATIHQEISHKVAQPYSTTNGCRNGCNLSSGVCLMKGGWACPKTRDSGKSVPSKQAGKGNTPSLNLWLL